MLLLTFAQNDLKLVALAEHHQHDVSSSNNFGLPKLALANIAIFLYFVGIVRSTILAQHLLGYASSKLQRRKAIEDVAFII